ncbi:MAG: FAD-dependent oxidoreductase [Chloroflexota bacterium]
MTIGVPSFISTGCPLEVPAYIHLTRCWPEVDKLSPCEASCPLHVDVPNYTMAISQDNIDRALAIIRESNPLPSVCGRVCHHPCEEECNRTVVDSAVNIQWLKRYAADWGNGAKPSPAPRTKKERVAIVGSGPAGLTAAHDLVKKGYGVTIFEASALPGGVLSSVIPDFILSPEAVRSDIDYLKALGVRLHTGIRIGKDVSFASLWKQGYKAVLIATGAPESTKVSASGSDLPGIVDGLDFLKQVKLGLAPFLNGKVWVIGGAGEAGGGARPALRLGGNVATNAARTALRLGASEVHIAYLESREDLPPFKWEVESAEKEGVQIHPSLALQEFTSKNGFKVGGISFKRIASTQEGAPGDLAVDADTVMVAVGLAPDMMGMLGESEDEEMGGLDQLNIGKTGGVAANERTLETSVPGIFAAGDISSTGGTVIESMAAGRRAATSIDQYLSGVPIAEIVDSRKTLTIEKEQIPAHFIRKERWEMPRLLPQEAIRTFREVDLGYVHWQAVEAAKRCMNCRMCANCIFERGQNCFDTGTRLL